MQSLSQKLVGAASSSECNPKAAVSQHCINDDEAAVAAAQPVHPDAADRKTCLSNVALHRSSVVGIKNREYGWAESVAVNIKTCLQHETLEFKKTYSVLTMDAEEDQERASMPWCTPPKLSEDFKTCLNVALKGHVSIHHLKCDTHNVRS